jgi:hypothetical protein
MTPKVDKKAKERLTGDVMVRPSRSKETKERAERILRAVTGKTPKDLIVESDDGR